MYKQQQQCTTCKYSYKPNIWELNEQNIKYIDQLKFILQDRQNQINDLSNQISFINENQSKQLYDQQQQAKQSLLQELSKQEQNLNDKFQVLIQQYEDQLRQAKSKIYQLEDNIKQSKYKIENLRNLMQDKTKVVDGLREQLMDLEKKQQSDINKQNEEQQNQRVAQLENQINNLQHEVQIKDETLKNLQKNQVQCIMIPQQYISQIDRNQMIQLGQPLILQQNQNQQDYEKDEIKNLQDMIKQYQRNLNDLNNKLSDQNVLYDHIVDERNELKFNLSQTIARLNDLEFQIRQQNKF